MMRKILLIDDDKGIIDLISQYLKKEGYEVFTAEDGPSGLKTFESFQPDLIVLDIMLPGFDGLELLSKITFPISGSSRRPATFKRAVLPLPFGPIIT